jgi:hypothetical protein
MPKILGLPTPIHAVGKRVPMVADLKHILFVGDGYSQDQP